MKSEMDANFVRPPFVAEHRDESIERRWDLVWKTPMLMESRNGMGDAAIQLQRFKTTHRSRCMALQHAGIKWRIILKHSLDNPLHSAELFEFQMTAAKRRSDAHPKLHQFRKRKPGHNPLKSSLRHRS